MSWFDNWFGTKYYNLLYGNRDEQEASIFVDNLVDKVLDTTTHLSVLDLCCGKGRHSYHLASKYDFQVNGCDLSVQNIKDANKKSLPNLNYFVHDMRHSLPLQDLDVVLNLFTSIGYFQDRSENLMVLSSVYDALKPKGKLIIDFFNAQWVRDNIHPFFTKDIEGITFNITKSIENDFIIKKIEVLDGENVYHYQEMVDLISLQSFTDYLTKSGFKLVDTFGDYELNPFDEKNSNRLILLAEKI